MKKLFKNKAVKITAIILLVAVSIPLLLELGFLFRGGYKAWRPDYEMEPISQTLKKDSLTDEDYDFLFRQTGLSRLGIDGLLDNGDTGRILRIQQQYFSEQEYSLVSFAPFTGLLKRKGGAAEVAVLENGDILYSPSTFFSLIRLGHSAIVIDETRGSFVQASGYGTGAVILPRDTFFLRPIFVILRVKTDKATRDAVAKLVSDELVGGEYSILAGIFGDKAPVPIKKTHCSHLVWYAYERLGIDIDSDGGKIVTPDDILHSDMLEVVQVYGMNPERLK